MTQQGRPRQRIHLSLRRRTARSRRNDPSSSSDDDESGDEGGDDNDETNDIELPASAMHQREAERLTSIACKSVLNGAHGRCLSIFASYLGQMAGRDWVSEPDDATFPGLHSIRQYNRQHQLQPNMEKFKYGTDTADRGISLFRGFLASYKIKCRWNGAYKNERVRPGIGVFNKFTSAMSKAFALARVQKPPNWDSIVRTVVRGLEREEAQNKQDGVSAVRSTGGRNKLDFNVYRRGMFDFMTGSHLPPTLDDRTENVKAINWDDVKYEGDHRCFKFHKMKTDTSGRPCCAAVHSSDVMYLFVLGL